MSPQVRRQLVAAASLLSTFQHRLLAVGANVKFRDQGEAAAALGMAVACRPEHAGLGAVVDHCKGELGVMYVYAWHALCGYWGGVSAEASEEVASRYGASMAEVRPSQGVLEVEPSWAWDPIAAGGVGLVPPGAGLDALYDDMHAYLAQARRLLVLDS